MKDVNVWDPFVRFFHWALVLSIILQLVTAESAVDIHAKVGYFIIFLLSARIIWGFVGTKHARFGDFIYPPAKIIEYLKGLIQRSPRHYVGHNPAGGAMVAALLFFLLLTTFTGLKTYGTDGKGPLAQHKFSSASDAIAHEDYDDDDDDDDAYEHQTDADDHGKAEAGKAHSFWKEIHESLVAVVITLIILHILGVLASSYVHRENLILAMITGKKKERE